MSVPKSAIPSYGLTHDLLNELTIVIGTCDLLQEEFLDYQSSRHVWLIREMAVRMSQRIAEHHLLSAKYAS